MKQRESPGFWEGEVLTGLSELSEWSAACVREAKGVASRQRAGFVETLIFQRS
jgi:hypothetical protein